MTEAVAVSYPQRRVRRGKMLGMTVCHIVAILVMLLTLNTSYRSICTSKGFHMMDRKLFLVVILALFSLSAVGAQESSSFSFRGLPGMGITGAMTSVTSLIKRADVQGHISMTIKQKNDLNDLMKGPQGIRVAIESQTPLSEEERSKKIREQIEAQLAAPEERIKSVLRPEQYSRLKELQLQWAGPLILSDSKTAAKVKISPEHQGEIGKIAAAYAQTKQDVMSALMQHETQSSPDGSQKAVMVRLNTKELENPVSPYTQKLTAAKKGAEQRIMAVLSAGEKDSWKTAQGAPFTFRTDLPGLRF
jgi:hypothetical protein